MASKASMSRSFFLEEIQSDNLRKNRLGEFASKDKPKIRPITDRNQILLSKLIPKKIYNFKNSQIDIFNNPSILLLHYPHLRFLSFLEGSVAVGCWGAPRAGVPIGSCCGKHFHFKSNILWILSGFYLSYLMPVFLVSLVNLASGGGEGRTLELSREGGHGAVVAVVVVGRVGLGRLGPRGALLLLLTLRRGREGSWICV